MPGDHPPTPKDPEIIAAERICEEMRDIAKRLPKPVPHKEQEAIPEFGNNFYMLFLGLVREQTKPNSPTIKTYLRKAEELYGEKWKKFLEDQPDLITQIKKLLEQKEILSELMTRYVVLVKNPKTLALADSIDEEIDLHGLSYDIWDKLSPLLKQASEAMTSFGMNPVKFYG